MCTRLCWLIARANLVPNYCKHPERLRNLIKTPELRTSFATKVFNQIRGRFELNGYRFQEDAQAYVSFSMGTLPSQLNTGFTSLPAAAQAQVVASTPVPAIVPENKLYNYELGVKGNFLDGKLQVLSDVYYAKWKDRTISAQLLYTNAGGVLALARTLKVLHSDWLGQVLFERDEDIFSRQLFECGAGRIEIPVLVLKICPGNLCPAAGRQRGQFRICGRVIDAGARGEQIVERRLFFDGEKWLDVVQAHLLDGFV